MGPLSTLLTLPIGGPLSGLGWLARQIAKAANEQMLDPKRIEAALLTLERRLEDGQINEATFEAEEALLLQELAEMAEIRAAQTRATESGEETGDDVEDTEDEVADNEPEAEPLNPVSVAPESQRPPLPTPASPPSSRPISPPSSWPTSPPSSWPTSPPSSRPGPPLPSWPGLSGPPPQPPAPTVGTNKPGHNGSEKASTPTPAPTGHMREAKAWISA